MLKIDFKRIIMMSGENISQASLAREMVKAGCFKNEKTAITCIQYHSSGKMKSVDYGLLEFLKRRFHLTESQILNQ